MSNTNQNPEPIPEKRTEFAGVYASIALALYRIRNFNMDEIREIISMSQALMKDYRSEPKALLSLCEDETGCIIVERYDYG